MCLCRTCRTTGGIHTLYLIPSAVSSAASPSLSRTRRHGSTAPPLEFTVAMATGWSTLSGTACSLFSRSPPQPARLRLGGASPSLPHPRFLLSFLFLRFFFLCLFSSPPSLAAETFRSLQIGAARPNHVLPAKLRRVLSPLLAVNQLPLVSLSFMCALQHLPRSVPPSHPPSLHCSLYS